ncbi:MAG: dCTP deaminase [Candidatus Melainabacteria bacterium]|nr:dCTP deaminase [Candidatus Melainabacteria bacterium]
MITALSVFFVLYLIHIVFYAPGNLVDWQMRLYMTLGLLRVDNHREEAIQPNSLDVHLGREFARQMADGSFEVFDADFITLAPGEFVLATTEEYFYFPSFIHGVLQGKSSWARLGLYVESAGLFDSGFEGEAVVELTNQGNSPLVLQSGKAIAQMIFAKNLIVANPYGKKKHGKSNYQGQRGAQQSALDRVLAKDSAKQDEARDFASKAELN